jgi:hypothetical protein
MLWIRVEGDLRTHPKTRRLARALGVQPAQVIGHLVCLWTYALAHAPDGDLRDLEPDDIAEGALYGGDPQALVAALLAVGLLDQGPAGLLIHDWTEYAAGLREAERKRQYRQRRDETRATDVRRTRPSPATDVRRTRPSPATDTSGNVPSDETRRDETRQDERSDESSVVPELTLVQAEPATLEPPDVVLTFPAVGRGAQAWHLTERLLEELQQAYPDLDCRAECRRALAWVQASPRRRKTARGYQAFLTAWLQRSQERPGGPIAARAGPSHPPKTQANLDTMRRWLERHAEDR